MSIRMQLDIVADAAAKSTRSVLDDVQFHVAVPFQRVAARDASGVRQMMECLVRSIRLYQTISQ